MGPTWVRELPGTRKKTPVCPWPHNLMPGAALPLCLLMVGVLTGESHGEAHLIPHSSCSSRILPMQKVCLYFSRPCPSWKEKSLIWWWEGEGALGEKGLAWRECGLLPEPQRSEGMQLNFLHVLGHFLLLIFWLRKFGAERYKKVAGVANGQSANPWSVAYSCSLRQTHYSLQALMPQL